MTSAAVVAAVLVCLLVASASSGLLLAQSATPTIRGRVAAADNAAPLPRARIIVSASASGVATAVPVFTDERGEFAIAAPEGPTVTLSVTKAGFAAVQIPLRRDALASGQPLAVAMVRAAGITGRIVDPTGDTVVGMRVYADRIGADAATGVYPPKYFTVSDDRGDFRLGGLAPGRYSVTATGALDPGAVATIDVRPGDEIGDINFVVPPPPETPIPDSPSQPPDTPERASIRGRVVAAGGRPIARVLVRLTGPMPQRYILTDAQGRFTATGLVPGTYEISASKEGYLTTTFGLQRAGEPARRIAVTAGDRLDGVDITLSRGVAVTGTLVDQNGEPLQGVSVQALQLTTRGGRRSAQLAPSSIGSVRQTDDRGRYRVLGLLPGTYVVAAVTDAGSFAGGASVSQPVPIYFPGSASIADAVTVDVGASDVDGIDFAVAGVPTARVTGSARDSSGAPLAGSVTLAVSARSGDIVAPPRTARVEPDGSFTFFHVAPGDYILQAVSSLTINNSLVPAGTDPRDRVEYAAQYVSVGGADAEPVALRTARGAALEGRITSDQEMPHDPYTRIVIEALPAGGEPTPVLSGLNEIRIADGRFRIGGLTGPRRFVLNGLPEGWYVRSMTIDGADVTDHAIDFGFGSIGVRNAEVVLSAGGGSVAGRVTDDQGTPVTDYLVIVFADDREKWFERSRFVHAVRAASGGTFRATSLPPGDYLAIAIPAADAASSGDWTTAEALDRLSSRAVRLMVGEGQQLTVDLRLVRP